MEKFDDIFQLKNKMPPLYPRKDKIEKYEPVSMLKRSKASLSLKDLCAKELIKDMLVRKALSVKDAVILIGGPVTRSSVKSFVKTLKEKKISKKDKKILLQLAVLMEDDYLFQEIQEYTYIWP